MTSSYIASIARRALASFATVTSALVLSLGLLVPATTFAAPTPPAPSFTTTITVATPSPSTVNYDGTTNLSATLDGTITLLGHTYDIPLPDQTLSFDISAGTHSTTVTATTNSHGVASLDNVDLTGIAPPNTATVTVTYAGANYDISSLIHIPLPPVKIPSATGTTAPTITFNPITTLYVNAAATSTTQDGTQAYPYHSIQSAIDNDPAGDTINVGAGTYDAFSVVGKSDLTITGAGEGVTNIIPTTLIDTLTGHKYTADMKASVFVNNSTDIVIQDMTIEGNGKAPGEGGPDAIVFWNASTGSVDDSAITGNYTVNGIQTGQGIAVDAGTVSHVEQTTGTVSHVEQTTSLTVNDDVISGFQKNGIDAVDGNSLTSNPGNITLEVEGGSITGAGSTTAIAQNGILVWNQGGGTVTGTVDGTTISDLDYSPSPVGKNGAAGILAYGTATVPTISNVAFTDTDYYIENASTADVAVDATTGNTFDGVSPVGATNTQLGNIENKLYGAMEDSTVQPVFILPNTFIATTNAANRGIKAAMSLVQNKGTVIIAPGTYTADINVVANDVTVKGDGSADTILNSDGSNGYGVYDDAHPGFNLSGITFNASAGDSALQNYILQAYESDGLTLSDDVFNGTASTQNLGGVDVNSTKNVSYDNVTVEGSHKNGFSFTSAYTAADMTSDLSSGITLNDITSENNAWDGIAFYTVGNDGGSGNISDVNFTGSNTISNNGTGANLSQGGIFIEGDSDANLGAGNTPAYTVTSASSTSLDLTHVAFSGNSTNDIINYQTAPVNAIGATFEGLTGDQMTGAQQTAQNAKIFDHLDLAPLGLVTYYNPQVTVTIDKFIDGQMATAASANSDAFPMVSSWDATNLGSGSGSYTLNPTGANSSDAYEAVTSEMTNGASYSTNEDTTGSLVGASCSDGKPYALAGYTTGATEAAAASSTPSLTIPSLSDITSNENIIVWNVTCPPAPTGPNAPEVITGPATGQSTSDATLNATNGDNDASQESFWVSTSTIDTSNPNNIPAGVYSTPVLPAASANATFQDQLSLVTTQGITAGGVNANMPAITPNTTYYYVAWANVDGTWYPGQVLTVTTSAPAPSVTTDAASGETASDATLNGTNGPVGATDSSFWVSTAPFTVTGGASPTLPSGVYSTLDLGAQPAGTDYDASLSSLTSAAYPSDMPAVTASTTYYYAAWVEVGGIWYPGAVQSFTTSASGGHHHNHGPEVITLPANAVTSSDASLNGKNGGDNATDSSFWVSTTLIPHSDLVDGSAPTLPTGVYSTLGLGAVSANTKFSAQLSSLATAAYPNAMSAVTPSTTYYYVAWSEVDGTWYHGDEKSFTTSAVSEPEAPPAPTATFTFPTPGPSATSFTVTFSEPVDPTEAANPANYFLTNWPNTGGSGPLTGNATVTYDLTDLTSTVTFTNPAWYLSPEQEYGVTGVYDVTETTDLSPDPTTAYTTALVPPTAPGAPTTTTPTTSTSQVWTWTPATAVDPTDDGLASDVASYSYEVTNDADSSVVTAWTNIGNVTTVTTNLPAGSYTLHVTATDNAGNTGPEADGQVVVTSDDDSGPSGALVAPTPTFPSDGATLTTAELPAVTWTAVTDANPPITYTYEVSSASTTNDDGSFTNPIPLGGAGTGLTDPQIVTAGTPDGTYYWHVQAVDSNASTSPWSATQSFTIDNPAPSGPAPTALSNSITVPENTATPITLTVSSGGTVTYNIVDQPANGTLSVVDGDSVTYTPNTNYTGGDSFTFQANNGQASNIAAITITVTPVEVPTPTATDVTATTTQGNPVTITLTATDPDENPLTYEATASPANGSLSAVSGDSVTYTPNADFTGTDTFDFDAGNGEATSSPATVTITVTAASHPTPSFQGFFGGGGGGQIIHNGGNGNNGGNNGNNGNGGSGSGQVLGASAYNFTKDLKVGSTGEDVTQLQLILIADGDLKITSPTGYFGALTKAAVMEYQAAHNISPVSGYVGPITRAVLNAGSV